jgi:hypothetical protein
VTFPLLSGRVASWAFLEGWELPPGDVPSWDALDALRDEAVLAAGAQHYALGAELARWDGLLREIGGEPAFRDWRRFRPLRLSREEDWSDWLGHLVETSRHGFLASELRSRSKARAKQVDREVPTVEGFRADLIVHWHDGGASHIEVKVGDNSFAKTFGTAAALRKKFPDVSGWSDHILLPARQSDAWLLAAPSRQVHEPMVDVLTWESVAVAIRSALVAKQEPLDWRVWGAAFIGAIEQTLLRLPVRQRAPDSPPTFAQLLLAPAHLKLLREASPHE